MRDITTLSQVLNFTLILAEARLFFLLLLFKNHNRFLTLTSSNFSVCLVVHAHALSGPSDRVSLFTQRSLPTSQIGAHTLILRVFSTSLV